MKAFLFSALFLSSSAFAAKISFTHFGFGGGRDSFYACSYAEGQTFQHLETLGATNISVSCSGGINPWSVTPVSIRATFDVPVVRGVGGDIVEIEGDTFHPACGLNVQIIKESLKVFPHIKVLRKDDSCAFANTNYFFKLSIQR